MPRDHAVHLPGRVPGGPRPLAGQAPRQLLPDLTPTMKPFCPSRKPSGSAHPRCPATTRYIFQGACQAGRGHLLGRRRASCALGTYSFRSPDAVGTSARVPWCNTSAPAAAAAVRAALLHPRGSGQFPHAGRCHPWCSASAPRAAAAARAALLQPARVRAKPTCSCAGLWDAQSGTLPASPGAAPARRLPPPPCAPPCFARGGQGSSTCRTLPSLVQHQRAGRRRRRARRPASPARVKATSFMQLRIMVLGS